MQCITYIAASIACLLVGYKVWLLQPQVYRTYTVSQKTRHQTLSHILAIVTLAEYRKRRGSKSTFNTFEA